MGDLTLSKLTQHPLGSSVIWRHSAALWKATAASSQWWKCQGRRTSCMAIRLWEYYFFGMVQISVRNTNASLHTGGCLHGNMCMLQFCCFHISVGGNNKQLGINFWWAEIQHHGWLQETAVVKQMLYFYLFIFLPFICCGFTNKMVSLNKLSSNWDGKTRASGGIRFTGIVRVWSSCDFQIQIHVCLCPNFKSRKWDIGQGLKKSFDLPFTLGLLLIHVWITSFTTVKYAT